MCLARRRRTTKSESKRIATRPRVLTVCAGLAAALAIPASAGAQDPCATPIALFESVKNSVRVVQASTRAPRPAVRQVRVCAGDTIQVGDNSRAVILILSSNTPIAIEQNTEFFITPAADGTRSIIDLLRGALLYVSRVPRATEIRTPFVNASIEGTEFIVRVQADRTVITVFEGAVRAENTFGTVVVGAGQRAVAVQGQAPQIEVVVRPRDAVQWALYYEPILPADSFDQLTQIPDANRDAGFYVRRAALLLGVGQLEAARSDVAQALQLDPSSGNAYALQTVVAVALNDKEGALTNGRAAVARAPESSSALVALSYALQANFRLEDARAAVQQAVDMNADDGAAWARLAELRLMLDDVSGAADAARRATALSPTLARAYVVSGFVSLARLDLSDAEGAFDRAIGLESDNPLARLGLGLAKIRRGRLAEGREDLELAVALNPDSSIVRSYLGKAYFDEKRAGLAEEQFDLAKERDQLDPTPWFYNAILTQAMNRPVEALRDLQRSVQLNGSRAIYRSRLLMDQDLGVRGARLGRIYRDVGFEHLALLEGWKSLSNDPGNHSAHRLLADSYLVLPRHGIARDSELLQAQLLQPLNINPVQPLIADNGLTFLDDTGVARPGFNEFTRLFAADQFRVVADGVAGEGRTRGDNVIVSGIADRLSFSVGQFQFDTDGVRRNNGVRQDVYNAFVQYEIAKSTSIQAEARKSDSELGDRRLLFYSDTFLPNQRNTVRIESGRLGLRHDLKPQSILLLSYAYRALDGGADSGVGIRTATTDNADSVEARYLHAWRRLNVTGGFGYFTGELKQIVTVGSVVTPATATPTQHVNAYVYSSFAVVPDVTIFGGVSGDRLERANYNRKQVNPKFGVAWNITPNTVLKGAAFRTLRRALVSSQTIEPTQVAGFNQFFDDANATHAWRYGVGIDHSVRTDVHLGAEVSLRAMKVPVFLAGSLTPTDTDREDQLAKAYAYITPARWLALVTDYQYEHLIREPNARNADLVARSKIHKLANEVRVFHRRGAFVRFRGSFVHQEGRFLNARNVVVPGSDRFWIADAAAGYRLPRQMGLISVDARNIFDASFNYQDSAPRESRITPIRVTTVRLTLTF